MAQLRPDGAQAVELLVNGDIKADAAEISLSVTVVVGGADTVTPPDGCKAVADSFGSSTFKIARARSRVLRGGTGPVQFGPQ